MTAVKICGVNSTAAFDAAIEAGADWLGFVFYANSPRAVSGAVAAALSSRCTGGPPRVGLFVGAADDEIARILDLVRLDVLQIYDTSVRLAAVQARFGLPVWRSVALGGPWDLPASCAPAAALLVEPPPPAGATRPGGNAVSLDWPMLADWHPDYPWLLAGGLTPQNVRQAIVESGASAVDVSSGVESSPGNKSPHLIRAFVRAAKSATARGAKESTSF